MSLDINLTNVESTTNKKTTLTDNSDTFYPTQKAVKTAVDLKVDKVVGKGLSTEDYTTAEKSKLAGIEAGAEVNVNADWDAISGDAQILNKPTIPSISGLVPYTGATADVNLDTFGLDAKFIKIKGTAGNGHLNLKHQSSDATAGGSESVLYADASGNPKWKNDGNAVQDVLLSGTTTADIADSTNKRYVTDAQFNVLGNTSGTNSGDQDLSGLATKSTTITINGTTYDLSANRSFSAIILSGAPVQSNSAVSGGARYFGFSDNVSATTETSRRTIITNPLTLCNFYIRTSGTQPATGSHVLTVLKNGVATGITVTIPAGSGAGIFSNTTHSISVVGGDEISIEAVNNASSSSSILVTYSLGSI